LCFKLLGTGFAGNIHGLREMFMPDQHIDAFGDCSSVARPPLGDEAISAPSPFLARFGTVMFWGVVAAIVIARVFVGV
jgi:hypothetical protein